MKILGKTFYEILDINQYATTDQLKSAYRKKMVEFHPDKNNNSQLSITITQDLTEVFNILNNPIKKAAYDQSISTRIHIIEKEPLARCIICQNPLDAFWKTYCSTHYREYKEKNANFYDEGNGACQICGDTTTASWKIYCTFHYKEKKREEENW